jgi:proteic killer suppression protein
MLSRQGIRPDHAARLHRLLDRLHAAEEIRDMNYPGSRLHLLEPKSASVWSVSVSGNWRVTFRFEESKAYDVDYLDYH